MQNLVGDILGFRVFILDLAEQLSFEEILLFFDDFNESVDELLSELN